MIRVQLKFGDDSMPPQKKLKISIGQEETPATSTVKNAEKESTTKGDSSDWRMEHWFERLHYAQTHHLLCDVTFEVEGKEFEAHKLLLAMASPVFEAMFFGGMAEKGDRVVITDLTADGFKGLLRYIYSNEISLSSMEEAFQLWVAADKYCVPHVKEDCIAHFGSCALTAEGVWGALQTALFLDIEAVAKRCFGFFEKNTEAVMATDDFTSISVGAMTSFLSLESLRASELILMKGLIKWGKARISSQPEMTLRQAVEPCIKFIRFGAMTVDEFCQVLDHSREAFSDSDSLTILKHLAKPTCYPLPVWCCLKSWGRTASAKVIPSSEESAAGSSRLPGSTEGGGSQNESRPHKVPFRHHIQMPDSDSESSTEFESSTSSSSTDSSDSSDHEERRSAPGTRRRGASQRAGVPHVTQAEMANKIFGYKT